MDPPAHPKLAHLLCLDSFLPIQQLSSEGISTRFWTFGGHTFNSCARSLAAGLRCFTPRAKEAPKEKVRQKGVKEKEKMEKEPVAAVLPHVRSLLGDTPIPERINATESGGYAPLDYLGFCGEKGVFFTTESGISLELRSRHRRIGLGKVMLEVPDLFVVKRILEDGYVCALIL